MAVAAVVLNTVDVAQAPGRGSALIERMEFARSRIEERFLDGGAALLSILDVLNRLIASLDQATGALDEETANATMAELQQTVGRLVELSRLESARQAGFIEISGAERAIRPHIDGMQETMRYLRTFAVTAKITGAGIDDFAGFAEEILDRIQAGTKQVNTFGEKLQELGAGLGSVIGRGEKIIVKYDATIPGIVTELEKGGTDIGAERKILAERADRVRKVAAGIQNKLASTLSAMQIGDITRQRIEHCQSALAILDEYLAADGAALDAADREDLEATITNLVAVQLNQTIDDFDRDTAKVVKTIESFRSDLLEIDRLRQAMSEGDDASRDTAMRRLEANVGAARDVVREIEAVATEAGNLSRSTGQTLRFLIDGIGVLQLVRTDIHYMALNTNLRCGKIGEQGRALNVVTAELRNCAGQLDEAAEKVLLELQTLEVAADKLNAGNHLQDELTLDERLARAMGNIRTAGDRMDAEMSALGEQSGAAIGQMDAALSRLDFKAELGEVLRGCAEEIEMVDCGTPSAAAEAVLSDLGGRIARLYTMASERELHAAILGTSMPASAPAQPVAVAAVMSDDDIEDALF